MGILQRTEILQTDPWHEEKGRARKALRRDIYLTDLLYDFESGTQKDTQEQIGALAGPGTTRHTLAQQYERDRHPGIREEAQDQWFDSQQSRTPLPGHVRKSEEDVPEAGSGILGLPQRPPVWQELHLEAGSSHETAYTTLARESPPHCSWTAEQRITPTTLRMTETTIHAVLRRSQQSSPTASRSY